MSRPPILPCLLICLALLGGALSPGLAQGIPGAPPAASSAASPPPSSAATPAPLSAEQRRDVEGLVQSLTDEDARNRLVRQLRSLLQAAPVAAEAQRDDWLADVTQSLGALSSGVLAILAETESLPALAGQAADSLTDPAMLERILRTVVLVAAVLVGALLAEWLATFLLRRPRAAVERRAAGFWPLRVLLMLVRTLLDVLPIAAFAAAAFGVLALVDMGFVVRLAVVTVINANVMARMVIAGGRALLAPGTPGLRLLPVSDESAAYVFLWVRRFAHTAIYGYFLLRTLWILGLSQTAYLFLGDLLGLLLIGMGIVFVLQVRAPVAETLRGRGEAGNVARLRRHFADFWHLLAIAYLVAVYVVWVLDVPGGFAYLARATLLTGIAMLVLRLVLTLLDRAFAAIFTLSPRTRSDYPLLEERANRYLPVLRRALQAVLVLLFALVVLEAWGGAPFEWLASQRGQALVGRGVSIAIVLLIGIAVWEAAGAFSDRMRLRHPGSTRLKTLLPFLQNALRIVLLTIAGLIVLSELGVNIAPLLAGAGVLGLAIGFGAQTLVKDVITGIFILMEDTLSVGDVVELGAHGGLVEKITIRTVHLRDFDGNVHSIPFSEVQTVKNMSKHFAFAVVDVRVAYREDIDEALAVMADVARSMAESGPLAETIIEPFEIVGVEALETNGVWLRGRFKTRPLGQWNVRREFYRRIKAAFDARGILIPVPQTMIYFGQDKKGNAAPLTLRSGRTDTSDAPVRRARDTARVPGPMIEEHPGARERQEDDDAPFLPAVEERKPH
ncbi:MAG: mechanosensitive ion channel protein [Rhizobiales bacterium 35-68-8]|nr:MAG: mechanosensitive ion channel protein [Rhizobiales bacterium 35-68-8]